MASVASTTRSRSDGGIIRSPSRTAAPWTAAHAGSSAPARGTASAPASVERVERGRPGRRRATGPRARSSSGGHGRKATSNRPGLVERELDVGPSPVARNARSGARRRPPSSIRRTRRSRAAAPDRRQEPVAAREVPIRGARRHPDPPSGLAQDDAVDAPLLRQRGRGLDQRAAKVAVVVVPRVGVSSGAVMSRLC